jgi:lipoprotein-anchoring transpeptidase ErfK/SrfK
MHGKTTSKQAANKRRISVSLDQQIVEAYDGDKQVHRFECVSGDGDHPTDKGHFTIMRKHHPYSSHTYHVPMNYAMFFTMDGKALHQYHGPMFNTVRMFKHSVSDWFGSHGCVRLREEDAKTLYDWASIGTSVHVF